MLECKNKQEAFNKCLLFAEYRFFRVGLRKTPGGSVYLLLCLLSAAAVRISAFQRIAVAVGVMQQCGCIRVVHEFLDDGVPFDGAPQFVCDVTEVADRA